MGVEPERLTGADRSFPKVRMQKIAASQLVFIFRFRF